MQIPSIQQMLEAGVHFGHQDKRWNPAMKSYIFMSRNGIHIIDLKKTQKALEDAVNLVSKTVAQGRDVLFVATKKQGRECVESHAERSGQYFMTERWLGGTLTNFKTVFNSIIRLNELEKEQADGFPRGLKKREILQKTRERERIDKYLRGIRHMKGLPGVVVVVDIKKEAIAVQEARRLGIPCVGIVDTNCDPSHVDYPIPANDDAIKSISLIVGTLADAALLGAEGRRPREVDGGVPEASVPEESEKSAPVPQKDQTEGAAPATGPDAEAPKPESDADTPKTASAPKADEAQEVKEEKE